MIMICDHLLKPYIGIFCKLGRDFAFPLLSKYGSPLKSESYRNPFACAEIPAGISDDESP